MSSTASIAPSTAHLPLPALLALAMTGFTAIMTETLPAGLLQQMAGDLAVPEALVGQLVSSYAAGSLMAAIPLVTLTQSRRRRPVLLAAIGSLLLFNTVTALSGSYALTLVARFLAGVAAGLAWGMLAGFARRMAPEGQQGRALAIAMVGTPIALSLGVPGGAFLGALAGWRVAFLVMSATTVLLIGWVLWKVPDHPGQPAQGRLSVTEVFHLPGVRPILASVFVWMIAHNVLYTYIAPFASLSGLGERVDVLLFAFGMAALAGIWVTGLLIDRMLRRLVLTSLVFFGIAAAALAAFGSLPALVVIAVVLWGVSFGGASAQLNTAIAEASGSGVDIASAMVTTVWNAAIAAGGIAGGLLLATLGPASFPPAVLALVAVALAIVIPARRNGFQSEPRSGVSAST